MRTIERLLPIRVFKGTRTSVAVASGNGGGPPANINLRSAMSFLGGLLSGSSNKSGVRATSKNVTGLPAAFACIRRISETIATLPIGLYERTNDSERKYIGDHPSLPLLNFRPNEITKSFDLIRDLVAYALIYPCAYLYIERNGSTAEPIALWLKVPTEVEEIHSQDKRKRYYRITGINQLVNESDVIRLTNIFGKSVVELLNEAFGTSLATQSFAAQYFANNGNVQRYATTPNGIKTDVQRSNIGRDLTGSFGPGSNEMPVLDFGLEIKELRGNSMNDSQALETRKWQAEEVCRIFSMPPAMIGIDSGARYNSVEMMAIEFLKGAILPWITALQQELRAKLLREAELLNHYFRFNTAGLLMADVKTRFETYNYMRQLGFTPNEIRELENYDPIDGGDQAFIQVNQIPLSMATDYATKLIEKGAQPSADNNATV